MRRYHVWHHVWNRAPGTEIWKHHAYRDEALAAFSARFYAAWGHEVQLRLGSEEFRLGSGET